MKQLLCVMRSVYGMYPVAAAVVAAQQLLASSRFTALSQSHFACNVLGQRTIAQIAQLTESNEKGRERYPHCICHPLDQQLV